MVLLVAGALALALSVLPTDAAAASVGSISGKVTATAGGAIKGIEACVSEPVPPFSERCATTAALGEYTIEGLAPGSYYVSFSSPPGSGLNYAAQEYPSPVTVAAGSDTPGIDAELAVGAAVRGTVTDEGTHAGLAGIEVCAERDGSSEGPSALPACVESGAGGSYELAGLPSGEYALWFTPPYLSALNYTSRYYKGAQTYAQATVLSLAAGEVKEGIDEALPRGGEISGQAISATTKAALSGIEACAYSATGGARCGLTDAAGNYTIAGLASGSYEVEFAVPYESDLNYLTQYFDGATEGSQAEPVAVTVGNTTPEVNAEMQPGGSISGTVTGGDPEEPLAGIEVCASGASYRCTATDASGGYTLVGLQSDEYTVHFSGSAAFAPQFFHGKARASEADAVAVTAGSPTAGIDAKLTPAASISGTVTVTNGARSDGIMVCAIPLVVEYEASCAYTDTTGNYTITGLEASEYAVEFSGNGANWLGQYFPGKSSQAGAEPVVVAAGEARQGVDATMQAGGQITGTVSRAADGQPVSGATVTVYTAAGSYAGATVTAANGGYSLSALESGTYKAYFSAPGANLVPQYYEGVSSLAEARGIPVTAGSATVGIGASLQPGGTITGTITTARDGTPASDGWVEIFSAAGEYLTSASSGADGSYAATGLPAGSYKLEFFAYGLEPQYYDGKASLATAEAVAVVPGETSTGINAVLEPPASLAGTVTSANGGGPVAGVEVCAYPVNGSGYACGRTGTAGKYVLSLPGPGKYKVAFSPGSEYLLQYYDGKSSWEGADELTVAQSEEVSGIDAVLQVAGHIRGTVTAAGTGDPLEGVEVCAHPVGEGSSLGCVRTGAEGHYDLGGLGGDEYDVGFVPPSSGPSSAYLEQYYEDKESLAEADPVTVPAGGVTERIDATLAEGGAILGKVTGVDGQTPLAEAEACAYLTEGGNYHCVQADPGGEYALRGLPSGEYIVYFYLPEGESVVRYYDGVESPEDATPVEVTAGEPPVTGIDGQLPASGSIAGTVSSAATGRPLADIEVCASGSGGYFGNCTTSAADGSYTLNGLAPGPHKVEFRSVLENYAPQYYEGSPTLEGATPVMVAEAATTQGINAAMVAAGRITGRVTSEGAGIGGIQICAYGTQSPYASRCASSESDGDYELAALPTGSYKVQFWAPVGLNYVTQYFPDKALYYEAEAVEAAPGKVTTEVDAAMEAGGRIHGRVTSAATEEAVAGIEVCPRPVNATGASLVCATTDAAGEYTLEQLAGGEYRVRFADSFNSTLNFAQQFFDHDPTLASATPISVVAGMTMLGVDASLEPGGEISGTVIRVGNKEPLQWVEVCPYEPGTNEPAGACVETGPDGEYTLRGLPAGQVDVEFRGSESVTQYYKEAPYIWSATGVPVEIERDTTGIDAALKSTHPIVPETISPPTIVGSPHQGEAVEEEHGSWTNEPIEYAYQWLRCDEFGGSCVEIYGADGQQYTPDAADVGSTLEVEEFAVNVEGKSEPATSQPTSPIIPEKPENIDPPRIGGLARAGEALEDEHGYWTNEPASYEYQWERCDEDGENCTLISGATGQTYELGSVDIGHTMRVIETAANLGGEGEPVASWPSAVVVPEVPSDLTRPSVTGVARQGETLSEEAGTWNGEPYGYEYQWERCDASGGACAPIPGAIGPTYSIGGADVGYRLVVAERAVNAGGLSEPAVSAPTATVVAVPPVNQAPPTISGPLLVGATVQELHGYWSNEPSSYSYQWERCSATGTGCEPIAGATEVEYVVGAADVGHELAVEEVASNAGGPSKGATSGATEAVVAAVPAATQPPTLSGDAVQGETLTEQHGTWTEGPTAYKITWERCDATGQDCAVVAGGYDDDEYGLTGADLGHTIRATEEAGNAGGYGDPVSSAPSERVVATAPVATAPPTISGHLVEGETLTEGHGSWADEPSSYSYQWERCSATRGGCEPITGAVDQTYTLGAADVGHELAVVETAANAAGPGSPVTSATTAVVRPAIPVNTGVPTISGTARVGSELTEAHGSWTNQPTSYSYQWELCDGFGAGCEPIAGATQQAFTPEAADLGLTLRVVEVASNAKGEGEPATSAATAAVLPEPPVDVTAPTIVGSPQSGETMIVSPGTWTHEPTQYREQWLRCEADGENCATIHDAINRTYAPVTADVGHALRVRETTANAGGSGDPAVSAPTAPVAAVPLKAVAGESIQATVGAPVTLDGSGSTPAGEITAAHWDFGDGSGGDGAILRHTYATAGHYTATLTVNRGTEASEASVEVTVTAPPPRPVTITVEDENGGEVAGAEVLYIGPNGTRIEAQTDSAGKAEMAGLPDGPDVVYVEAEGFAPAVGQVSVSGGEGGATVALKRGALGAAKLTSHEMDLVEIEAAGIDTSDPANRMVHEFEAAFAFPGGSQSTLICHINSVGEFVGSCGGGGGGGGGGDGGGGGGASGDGGWSCYVYACYGEGTAIVGGATEEHPFIERLVLTGKVTVLKQFFKVGMEIFNLSPEPFKFTHGQATLSVPAGLSLAPTGKAQSATQSVGDIPGEGSAAVEWVLRGDDPGEYSPVASYHGQLEPFEKGFELQAGLVKPLKVWGAEAFGFDVKAESGSLAEGVPYHVRIGIVDEADIPFYNVSVGIDSSRHERFVFQPGQEFESSVAELKPGETIYAPEDILVPDADGGTFDPSQSYAHFVGEAVNPGEGIEAVAPAPLYSMSATLTSATAIHLHWQPSPGAEGYEVFSTPDLDTAFGDSPDAVKASPSGGTVTQLPASATDAYVKRGAGDPPRFYAVATLVDGRLRLEHPVREPSIQGPVGGPLTLRELLAGGHNLSEFCLQCTMDRITHADPVDAPTGDFWHSFTDLTVPGRGQALDLERTYNSQAPADGPFGHGWSFTYGMSLSFPDAGHVVVEQENGSTVTFTEEPDGSYTAPPRVTATLAHEGDGSWAFVRHRRATFSFDDAGRLTREDDLDGDVTSLAYDAGGQLESVTDPAGRELTFTWEGGHIATVTDPLGRTVHYAYDAAGDLTDVTDVAGGDTHFTYDAEHRMLTMRFPDQAPGAAGSGEKTVTNVYDAEGRVVEQTDQLGDTTKFAYEGEPLAEAGGTTKITDPEGNVTVQSYRYGELIAETQGYGTPEAATWSFAYDPETLGLTSVTDPEGDTTSSTYDAEGNLLSSEDALGHRTVDTYDDLNDLLTSTDPMGVTTTYSYDARGNLLGVSRPLVGTSETQTATYTYGDPSHPGDVTAMTNPDGKTWHYAYDADGDQISNTDPLGDETTYRYNAVGWLTAVTSPRGNVEGAAAGSFTTTYDHDAFGLVTETVEPPGNTTSAEYDADQNLIASSDAEGHVTHYVYDAAERRTAVQRPDGTMLRTAYWPDGMVKEQVDGAGAATTYAYDALGRLVSSTDPLHRTTRHGYDAAGDETSTTDPEGEVTTKAYDADGELTSVHYSDGKTPAVTDITYDADGERTGMTDGTGTWAWTWDSLHRLTAVSEGDGGAVGYGYDLAGQLTAITYPNGKTVSRGFDAAGRLTAVSDWLGHTMTFGYDPDGNLTGEGDPSGVAGSLTYDEADRLASIQYQGPGGTLASFDYRRDPDSRVESETADNGGTATTAYSYDSLGALTSAGGDPYGYDAADNPTGFGTGTTQTFDAAGQLTTRVEPGEPGEGPGEGSEMPEGPTTPETPVTPEVPMAPVAPAPTAPAPAPGTPGQGAPPAGKGSGAAPHSSPAKGTTVHATSTGGRLTTPKLKTHHPGELLVALVSAAGPAGGAQRVSGVSGGGLHWTPVVRKAEPGGDAEVWQAQAQHPVSGKVSVTLRAPGHPATLTVEAYRGAKIKAHAAAQGHHSPAAVTVHGVGGALILAAADAVGQQGAVAPLAGQKLLSQYADPATDGAGWVQQAQSSSASARVGATTPAANWAIAAVAVVSTAPTAQVGGAAGVVGAHPSAGTGPTASPFAAGGSSPRASTGAADAGRIQHLVTRTAGGSTTITRHYTYDARGNRTAESGGPAIRSFTYDQADRLIGVGHEVSYAYNGDGLRMSKTVDGATTQFAWAEAEGMPELLQAGTTSYVYGPEGRPLEQITGSSATYLHTDQQGSVRLLTDASGTVTARYDYTPWGTVAKHTGSATTNLQFDGQYTDAETGFQYLRARYYDPTTGQFVTVDPLVSITNSAYGFAESDPVNEVDPTGDWSVCVGLCIAHDPTDGWGIGVGSIGADPTNNPHLGIAKPERKPKAGPSAEAIAYQNGTVSVSGGICFIICVMASKSSHPTSPAPLNCVETCGQDQQGYELTVLNALAQKSKALRQQLATETPDTQAYCSTEANLEQVNVEMRALMAQIEKEANEP